MPLLSPQETPMIDLTQLAEVRHRVSHWVVGHEDEVATIAALDAVLEAHQIIQCSRHGFRATSRCVFNDACSLQGGVFVPITPSGDTDGPRRHR